MASRGIRNNNPGNIDFNPKNAWQGQLGREILPAGGEGRFARFDAPENGIRAIARLLVTYNDRYGLDTVREIIDRWAPPGENNTEAYVQATAKSFGVQPDDPINVGSSRVMGELVRAIIRHENGAQPYSDDVIEEGVRRALGAPAPEVRPAPVVPEAPVIPPSSMPVILPTVVQPEAASPPPSVPQTNHKAWAAGLVAAVTPLVLGPDAPLLAIVPEPYRAFVTGLVTAGAAALSVYWVPNKPRLDAATVGAAMAQLQAVRR